MHSQNYNMKNDSYLRRSNVFESQPLQHHQVNSQQRPGVLKRSSFAGNQNYHSSEFSNPSNYSISHNEQNLPNSLYYHQSSYQVSSLSQPSSARTSYS